MENSMSIDDWIYLFGVAPALGAMIGFFLAGVLYFLE